MEIVFQETVMTEVEREQEIFRVAHAIFNNSELDWVTFFREVLGAEGIIRRMYPDAEVRAEFERSHTYREIQRMLKKLRDKQPVLNDKKSDAPEIPTSVITVRLPTDVYAALQKEAGDLNTSVNKLCISKLLQSIDDDLVPRRRTPKHKPGSEKEETKKKRGTGADL